MKKESVLLQDLEWQILEYFYPQEEDALRQILVRHSMCVRDKALEILNALQEDSPVKKECRIEVIRIGAMLHDIGIRQCSAPSICCTGDRPYLTHGLAGGEYLRLYGAEHGLDLECYARICERHTGAGLTALEIRQNGLPLPEQDFLPETAEEKLICLADKFFSKSGSMREKSLEKVRASMEKFGPEVSDRFEKLCMLFEYKG